MTPSLPKSFASILGDYLVAYEGHTEDELDLLFEVERWIPWVTLSELINEYNKLTVQKLWAPPLVSVFNDELLGRTEDTSFLLSVTWRTKPSPNPAILPVTTIGEFEIGPVYGQIGYDDSYFVLGPDQMPISAKDPDQYSFFVSNETFYNNKVEDIQRMFLKDVTAVLSIESYGIRIQKIYTTDDPLQHVTISEPSEADTITTQVRIIALDEFGIIRAALQGIRDNFKSGTIDYWPIDRFLPEEISEEEE